ncbi:MAG TPA: hypothetical protein VM869_19360 [Enhygromyxa sp.]|nr:hypothetical protein [Enhygromyxa sp.]
MSQKPYPLAWPIGRPRSQSIRSKFKGWSVAGARDRLLAELARFGAADIAITSNVELRIDGLPYSGRREPDDSGIAVYFKRAGKPYCMAVDRYDRVADNMHALALVIESYRAIERHGGATLLEQATFGFMALGPAPEHRREPLTKAEKLRAIAASTSNEHERQRMLERAAQLEANNG